MKNNKEGVIYTCITGNYDELNNHSYINSNWDYVCFTDDLSIKNKKHLIWKIKPLIFSKTDNVRINRWHKIHPHVLFPKYKRSIYMDANINILNNKFFNDINTAIKKSSKISMGIHPTRNCIYDEMKACLKYGKDDSLIMKKQMDLIKKSGFPKDYGLFENNIIYREHNDKDIIKIMNDWWWWVLNYSRRDQLSFMYVLWKNKFKVLPLSNNSYRNSYKISFWKNKKHITKEELIQHKKILYDLHKKIKNMQKS